MNQQGLIRDRAALGRPVRVHLGTCRDASAVHDLARLLERPTDQDSCIGFPGPCEQGLGAWEACLGSGWSDSIVRLRSSFDDALADSERPQHAALIDAVWDLQQAGFTFFLA